MNLNKTVSAEINLYISSSLSIKQNISKYKYTANNTIIQKDINIKSQICKDKMRETQIYPISRLLVGSYRPFC